MEALVEALFGALVGALVAALAAVLVAAFFEALVEALVETLVQANKRRRLGCHSILSYLISQNLVDLINDSSSPHDEILQNTMIPAYISSPHHHIHD